MSIRRVEPERAKKGISKKRLTMLLEEGERHLGTEGRGDGSVTTGILDEGTRAGTIFALVNRDGYCRYSRNVGFFIDKSVLVGIDPDSGVFAIRVPATCRTLDQAIAWMIPAEVKRARAEKREVCRQGDIYFVRQLRGGGNMSAIDRSHSSHEAERTADGWIIRHAEHATLYLQGHAWKAIPQRRLAAGGTD